MKSIAGTLVGLVFPAAIAAGNPDLPAVPLAAGETRLAEIGIYQVGWRSRGAAPVVMPLSWHGESDPATGIAYQIKPSFLGREALMMHSPWRVPGGAAWVDYRLALPTIRPITLAFGIAMEPSAALPGKSDGVTFSAAIKGDGGEHELLRRHWDKGEWEDHALDLSAHAGKTITLRLQVEPGPEHNASWDFSHFGDPRITIGGGGSTRNAAAGRLLAGKAWKATSAADMRALSNTPAHGIAPSNLLPFRNSLEQDGNRWRFVYQADDCRIEYLYQPETGALGDFTASIDGGAPFRPAAGGGVGAGGLLENGRLVSLARRGDELAAVWEYPLEGGAARVHWTFAMRGKALRVTARCEAPVLQSFSLGQALAPLRRPIDIPYLDGRAEFLAAQGVFSCRFLDWTMSNSSRCPQSGAVYDRKTDGTRNPLFESGYIAVSPELAETLPNIPHPASPHIGQLAPRVVLDVWGHHQGRYAGDTAILRALKDHGVDHLAIIQHDWQHHGYDVKLPDHLPANPRYGGEDELRGYGRAAAGCGYLWALHENYIDLYPDAPSYDPAARVLREDGTPSPAWFHPGTRIQSFGLKCDMALDFAKRNSPEIHRRYGTTAAYLDVHSCVPPWHQLDHDAARPMAAIARHKVERDRGLFQYERDTHGGPLFGEGNNHFYWAGLCDGVEAQVRDGEDHLPLLEFDLLKIHPQMVNHGMGYYERWFRTREKSRWGYDAGSTAQLDKYRAMELAYGHAGFIGAALTSDIRAIVREHHLTHPVQRLYGNAKPVEIRYDLGGRLVSGGIAMLGGDTTRQRIRYDSGLTLWVNWSGTPWRPDGTGATLPQWGFLALGPDTRAATALHGGKPADYAEYPGFLFADARTDLRASRPHKTRDIEPRLRELTHLGGNRVRATYEWRVAEKPGGDFLCFVHGTHPDEPDADHIAFQQDHRLAKPTTEWNAGDVIVDGPHEFAIPTDRDWFDLTIGLYQGARLRLKGPDDGKDRVALARIEWLREDGRITGIRRSGVPATALSGAAEPLDFTAHTNPPGTWIDFGKVATDGALLIRRDGDTLVVFPYPRDRDFSAAIDVKALLPGAEPSGVKVRALAAETMAELGEVESKVENGRLVIRFGAPGAGRYLVERR